MNGCVKIWTSVILFIERSQITEGTQEALFSGINCMFKGILRPCSLTTDNEGLREHLTTIMYSRYDL